MWKSSQHIITPKYDILHFKHYNVTYEEDNKPLKINCRLFDGFFTCSEKSGELLYITFTHAVLYTLGINTEDIDPKNFYFQWPATTKM